MLSAENVALENRAIRLMLQIREKELNYITNKYNAMGTQAALVGGFTVTTLTSLTIGEGIPYLVRWLFFAFSSISLSCSISCILNATFVTVWGPGLALRGPRGSMAKAYYGMVYEQKQIFGSFVIAIFFFAAQSIVAFWVIDAADNDDAMEAYSYFATIAMLLGGVYAFYALRRMHFRFHALSPDELNLRPSLPFVQEMNGAATVEDSEITALQKKQMREKEQAGGGVYHQEQDAKFAQKLRRFSLLGGGLTSDQVRASVTNPEETKRQGGDAIPTNFHGYLQKKSHHRGGMQYLHGDPWKPRWFVLQDGKLYYYITEEEWKQGKPPRNEANPINMGAYEVMVNPKDFDWGFMLESVGNEDRDWELRAESEALRLAWIKVLLKSSLLGGNRGSDMEILAGANMDDSMSSSKF
mmetsp:Transcript_2012/g.3711  ORF Transcript_2012/g.3711 Transcript_2012/m.3711 type:complete len:412 (+) Transcript_2012:204-1439(+)|eukprot:CAMPEP_0182473150 /NCGR_PEP_ID=MMETSP1319-20130603/23412_1 /TAXON_ID=172717 /ORGANISM="Bolidomonas pacifica, Strain RCC208" /LENGTH=411 /DNA_ID=CAMNT_0024673915 /DNA_START=164 /DNA_END=1399 /DNA_ORIENTATION=+